MQGEQPKHVVPLPFLLDHMLEVVGDRRNASEV